MMRHSSFLLALSLGLHAIDNHVTEATAETVNDPNKAHTFLEIKNGTHLQGSNEDDERMFQTSVENIRSFFSEKTPEWYFNKFLEGAAVGASDIEKVNAGLQAMKPEQMKRAVEVFKRHNMFLADKLIDEWGIEALATALVKPIRSEDENIKTKRDILFEDLLNSLEKRARGGTKKVFERLKLDDKDREFAAFIDGRVEVLYEFVRLYGKGVDTEKTFFQVLKDFFGGDESGYANLAQFIFEAVAKDPAASVYVTRFVNHLAKNVDSNAIIEKLGFRRLGYKLFQQPEYKMLIEFFSTTYIRLPQSRIPHDILYALIRAYEFNKGLVALMLSEGVKMNDPQSKRYELLLFKDLKFNNENIESIFTRDELKSDLAQDFVERYREWLLNGKKDIESDRLGDA